MIKEGGGKGAGSERAPDGQHVVVFSPDKSSFWSNRSAGSEYASVLNARSSCATDLELYNFERYIFSVCIAVRDLMDAGSSSIFRAFLQAEFAHAGQRPYGDRQLFQLVQAN